MILVPYGLLTWRFAFVSDDAFISFRYAKNWVEGNGLRYNLGESTAVEGYSNFLWVVASAGIELLGGDETFWAPLTSAFCGALLLVFVHRALRDRLGLGSEVSFFTTLALALFPPFAVWGTGGLETMPFALTLFLTFDRLVLAKSPAPVSGAILALATGLLRIEGICWGVLVGVLALLSRSRERRAIRSILLFFSLFLGGYLLYFAGRYAYYGQLLPNPVYLKVGFGSDVLLRGYRYVALFFLTFLTPFLLFPSAVVSLWRAPRRMVFPTVLMAIAFPAYAVVVGGDWMIMGRFLVPGLPFQSLLFGWLLNRLRGESTIRRAAAAVLVAASIGIGLLPGWNLHLVPRSVRVKYRYMYSHPGFRSEYEEWQAHKEGVAYASEVGLALKRHSRPGDSVVVGAIGAIGYYSDLFVYDRFGLVSREVADFARQEEREGPLRSPGHDVKVSRDFFLAEHPTYLVFDAIESRTMRTRVMEQAEAWRSLGSLWRRYAPDFIILDGKSVAETHRVLMVLRAVEDAPERKLHGVKRSDRRRLRAERAEAVWRDFYERAARLPDD